MGLILNSNRWQTNDLIRRHSGNAFRHWLLAFVIEISLMLPGKYTVLADCNRYEDPHKKNCPLAITKFQC